MKTIKIPIIGVVEYEKVAYLCPKCKKPRKARLNGQIATEICNECLLKIEEGLKKQHG